MKQFIENSDGTITDTKTGLMWAQDGNGAGCMKGLMLTWAKAIDYCKKLNFAGHKDWRLPTVEELFAILDYKKHNPAICGIFANTKSSWYWSLSEYVPATTYAWGVYFNNGSVDGRSKMNYGYVRAVRSGL